MNNEQEILAAVDAWRRSPILREILRDLFAGMAMAGYLAMHALPECDLLDTNLAARHAYQFADALLDERDECQ